MSIETVSIVGVGLIGGSFGLALKKRGFAGRIIGVSSDKTIEKALAVGAIDESAPLKEAVAQSDLVFLSTPVPQIIADLPRVAAVAKDGAIITDAGSAKAAIADTAQQVFNRGAVFIGGHPMAGKEGRGVEIADADLFVDATWVLTPASEAHLKLPAAVEFAEMIRRIGARQHVMTPSEHDRVVAWTSHLPQLLSTTLAHAVHSQISDAATREVAGPGLRDMSRLAESPFDMWRGIFASNTNEINLALKSYQSALDATRDALREIDGPVEAMKKEVSKTLDPLRPQLDQMPRVLAAGQLSKMRTLFDEARQAARRIRATSGVARITSAEAAKAKAAGEAAIAKFRAAKAAIAEAKTARSAATAAATKAEAAKINASKAESAARAAVEIALDAVKAADPKAKSARSKTDGKSAAPKTRNPSQ